MEAKTDYINRYFEEPGQPSQGIKPSASLRDLCHNRPEWYYKQIERNLKENAEPGDLYILTDDLRITAEGFSNLNDILTCYFTQETVNIIKLHLTALETIQAKRDLLNRELNKLSPEELADFLKVAGTDPIIKPIKKPFYKRIFKR